MFVSSEKSMFKINLLFLILLGMFHICPEAFAQYRIDKAIDQGEDSLKFVWLILAEGYTEEEYEKFHSDTTDLIDSFLSTAPFKEYKSAINIYTIFTPSYESGADHPSEGKYVDTAFDATYDTYGMARLLTISATKAFNAAAQVPQFDVVFVLVNDEQYGGSGGSVIAVSTNHAASEIALHEAGHVIGRLADEYETPYPGYPEGDWEPNVTFQKQREKVPWKKWIDPDMPVPTASFTKGSVGLFEGARYLSEGIYRPTLTSKMRSLNQPFFEVNTAALILRIYNYVDPIEKFGPNKGDIDLTPGSAVKLWVETLPLETYEALWEIDDKILESESQMSLTLLPSMLKQGKHSLSIWVSDFTEMVRIDNEGVLTSQQTWNIHKSFCSGKLAGTISSAENGQHVSDALIMVSNTNETLSPDKEGRFELSDIACGTYLITVEAPGFLATEEKISIFDAQETAQDIVLKSVEGTYYISGTISGEIKENVNIALSGDASDSVKTDHYGRFILGPLEPGSFFIEPNAAGYRFFPRSQKVSLEDKSISEVFFKAKKSGLFFFISGSIQGDVREGVIVSVSGEKNTSTLTDAQGNFIIEDLLPGQYVLKPRFSGLTFEPSQIKTDLSEKDLEGLKFMVKESPCPASQILPPGSPRISRLRQFRDKILKKHEKGRLYTYLYYLLSPEVSKLLRKNNSLKQEALAILNACMPSIEMLQAGRDIKVSEDTLSAIKTFTAHLSREGSPLLQKVMEHFLKDLAQKNLLQDLSRIVE